MFKNEVSFTFADSIIAAVNQGETEIEAQLNSEVRLAQHLLEQDALLEEEAHRLDAALDDWRTAAPLLDPVREEELRLVAWLRRQRFDLEKGLLSAEQVHMLDTVMPEWREAADSVSLSF